MGLLKHSFDSFVKFSAWVSFWYTLDYVLQDR